MRSLLLLLFVSAGLLAQEGYDIRIELENYDQDYLLLANNVLDKQYVVDTAYRQVDGSFQFRSDTAALPAGIYLAVMAPDNNYFQFLVGDGADDREFTLATRADAPTNIKAQGSEENRIFFDYMNFLAEQQRQIAPYREQLADTTLTEAAREAIRAQMKPFDARVSAYQDSVVENAPASFTAAIINTNRAVDPPAYEEIADDEERRTKQWRWLQQNYLDGIDLKDERLLRTPFFLQRIDYYVNKLHVQHPDSLAVGIDRVLERTDPESDIFKYLVIHYTNQAAQNKIVGMDALYVHMVDNYYKTGMAYWSDEEQLTKLVENADRIRPLLIGKQAPNLKMQTRDGEPVELYGTDAEYTILYFWRYDCPACKKSTPVMKEFYEKWKDRDVKIFSVCTKGGKDLPKCWDYVDEKEIGDWVQTVDPYQRFYKNYDVRSTPLIFVLDRDKQIVSKQIGAQQLDALLTALENQKAAAAEGK